METLTPYNIERIGIYSKLACSFIFTGCIIIFIASFFYQLFECSNVIKPSDEFCKEPIYTNILINNLIVNLPIVWNNQNVAYIVDEKTQISLSPLIPLISNDDVQILLDQYTSYDMKIMNYPFVEYPLISNFSKQYNIPILNFSNSVIINYSFKPNKLFNIYNYNLNNGLISFIISPFDNPDQILRITKQILYNSFKFQISGNYDTGLCYGSICQSKTTIIIISFLNAVNSIYVFSSVFMFLLFRYYKSHHNIDIRQIMLEKDRIIIPSIQQELF